MAREDEVTRLQHQLDLLLAHLKVICPHCRRLAGFGPVQEWDELCLLEEARSVIGDGQVAA